MAQLTLKVISKTTHSLLSKLVSILTSKVVREATTQGWCNVCAACFSSVFDKRPCSLSFLNPSVYLLLFVKPDSIVSSQSKCGWSMKDAL